MNLQDGKYLTFFLEKEDYGIPILRVKEIIGMMEITKIPRVPEFIKGVINLRGKIIPIMDLRLKFSLDAISYNERTCIIVVENDREGTSRQMGIVVDTVSEVVNIQAKDIEPPPSYGILAETTFLIGMGKVKDRVVMLLDIDNILDRDEMKIIGKLSKESLKEDEKHA